MGINVNIIGRTAILFFIGGFSLFGQPTTLPLIQIDDLEYQGAFIIPPDGFGESSANYSTGTIEYNKVNKSLFVSGFNLDGGIAEFLIPQIVNSTNISELHSASILQDFKKILSLTDDNNPQGIDRISGMEYVDGRLIVQAIEYYDAPADNTHTSLVLENASDINNTLVSGYYSLEGAAHTVGWISQIPSAWHSLLGGEYLSGNSSKHPINGRLPIGISAFVFNPLDISGTPNGAIPTTKLLDFNLADPLYADYSSYVNGNYNLIEVNGTTFPGHTFADADAIVGTNSIWTEYSQASYGFIIPETRTYLTVGSSGGHNSGIGYKATQNNGNLCGGSCPYDADDVYNYYWLWDVNDLLDVKNGIRQPHELRPYSYGTFDVPFQTNAYYNTPEFHPILGGAFDQELGVLYLTIYNGGATESPYDRNPVIVAYKLKDIVISTSEPDLNSVLLYPNPASDVFEIAIEGELLSKVFIINEMGLLVMEVTSNKLDISKLVPGLYNVRMILKNGKVVSRRLMVHNTN